MSTREFSLRKAAEGSAREAVAQLGHQITPRLANHGWNWSGHCLRCGKSFMILRRKSEAAWETGGMTSIIPCPGQWPEAPDMSID